MKLLIDEMYPASLAESVGVEAVSVRRDFLAGPAGRAALVAAVRSAVDESLADRLIFPRDRSLIGVTLAPCEVP